MLQFLPSPVSPLHSHSRCPQELFLFAVLFSQSFVNPPFQICPTHYVGTTLAKVTDDFCAATATGCTSALG